MGDYTSLFAGSVMINDEGTYPGKMQVMIESDSLGKVTIKFGNSLTLRLDSESAGKLAELIIEPESPCAAVPKRNVVHKHDHEGKMARKQLDRTASLSHSLADRLDDNMQLPAWVQSKITKAADYIQSVHNYLDEDLHEGKKKKTKI